jgi:hypothetical protein
MVIIQIGTKASYVLLVPSVDVANNVGRQQRRLLALDLQAEQPQPRMTGHGIEGLISPDSDASSGGHRFMYGRNLGIGINANEEDQSDKRSSTSSTGWMMKNPLRQPLVLAQAVQTQTQAQPGLKIDTGKEDNT